MQTAYVITQGFHNAPHRKRFSFDKNVAKKSVTQELAASN